MSPSPSSSLSLSLRSGSHRRRSLHSADLSRKRPSRKLPRRKLPRRKLLHRSRCSTPPAVLRTAAATIRPPDSAVRRCFRRRSSRCRWRQSSRCRCCRPPRHASRRSHRLRHPRRASARPSHAAPPPNLPGAVKRPARRNSNLRAPSRRCHGQTAPRGYTDYLRRPGLPQLAGAALPGVAGIVLMTLGGGVIGYRQANAGRMIQASGAARYLP